MSAPRIETDVALGAETTYRVGGSVAYRVTIEEGDGSELARVVAELGLPAVAVGQGSNLLVGDGRLALTVVRVLTDPASLVWRDAGGGVSVEVGAGWGLPVVARRLVRAGITGFEWAVGIPGSVGGAVAMNAGGHGSSISEVLDAALVWRDGVADWIASDQLDLSYRHSAIQPGDVVLRVRLALTWGDAQVAEGRLKEIVRWRRENQPGGANAGSVFQNPANDHAGRLLEAAGCKGLRRGGAVVSDKHANFILTEPGGRAGDVLSLMREMRRRVALDAGVVLQTEHRLLGVEEGQWPADPLD